MAGGRSLRFDAVQQSVHVFDDLRARAFVVLRESRDVVPVRNAFRTV
jgi:hypothetical protein